MNWLQAYDPLGNIYLSSAVAAIPLLLLLYMLGIRRSSGHAAAIAGTGAAFILAVTVFKMPLELAFSSTIYGMLIGIFPIIWIVLNAIWVYNMTVESGEFEIIKNSLANLTDDRRLQAIFVAFSFGAFIEGTAGFGSPVAITAAMLAGLGFNKVYAAGLCLLANTAPVAFGGLGIPIIVAAQVTDLDVMKIGQIAGRQLPFMSLIVPLWVCVTMSGWKKSMEVLPALVVAGGSFAITQFFFANFHGPALVDIMSAVVSILAMILLLKFWQPKNTWHFPDEAPVDKTVKKKEYTTGQVIRAWMPYVFIGIMIFCWSFPAIKAVTSALNVKFIWPGLHNVIIKTAPIVAQNTPYGAIYDFSFGTSTGTAILVAGLLSMFVIPGYGFSRGIACYFRTVRVLKFSILTIATVLGLAFLMNYSGMSATLGLAFAATGFMFPFFAPILGWMGVFLTGSDTSSNALFGNLQKTTALQVGVDPHLTVAANTTGGVVGKMISPQSISVATAATGIVGQEGSILRFTVVHSLGMLFIICIINILQAYVLNWMLP